MASKQDSPLPNSYPAAAAISDFYGLPSNPRCIYKTGKVWPVPPPPEAQRIMRETRPVCDHPIQDRWLDIGRVIYQYLDSCNVNWSSIDPVRFAETGMNEVTELHLWIGVIPQTLTFNDAVVAAEGCKHILAQEGFPNVEIAFRHSIVTRSSGPKLLPFAPLFDPIAELRSPFTTALGIQIAPLNTPNHEGTGALYIRESSQSNRIFLLTARHVVLPHHNQLLSHKHSNQAPEEIVILGTSAYTNAINHMMKTILGEDISISMSEYSLNNLGPVTEGEEHDNIQMHLKSIKRARKKIESTNKFHEEVTGAWASLNQRVIGYAIYSPPIGIGHSPKHFTRDWALIDIYHDKIDWDTFLGNQIYIGGNIPPVKYVMKMLPHHQGHFKYPTDGLLQIRGVVKEDQIHKPQQLDVNGEKCLIVVKNGKTTGTTIGRLSSMESFVRWHSEDGIKETSIQIAVYPYSKSDRFFSDPGDSGAMVVDSNGGLIGMIVGGAGKTSDIDVTYLTPYWWIEEEMKKVFPDCFLYKAPN